MMFGGDLAKKKIKVLSGGERARVLLGKLLARPTNLLLLDEPTNHLDQESVEALTLELQNYPGAVVIVTHSEGILREAISRLVVFHQGRVEYFPHGYNDFLEKIGWEEELVANSKRDSSPRLTRDEQRRLRADLIQERSKKVSPLRKQMEKLEGAIFKMEEEQGELEESLITLASSGDSPKIQEVSTRLAFVRKKVEEDFDLLTEVTSEHDQIMAEFELRLNQLEP